MTRNNFKPRKMLGTGAKIIASGVVLIFLGILSLNFFEFFFPPDQWYFAYLGFGLTSMGVILYMLVFKFDADTPFKRTLAVVMVAVCLLGELATAGYGMQVQMWQRTGIVAAEETINFMVIAVQVLGLFHGLMLIMYFAGDEILELFRDEDGDGIPNIVDSDYRRKSLDPTNRP